MTQAFAAVAPEAAKVKPVGIAFPPDAPVAPAVAFVAGAEL